jgi:hypothetical protein
VELVQQAGYRQQVIRVLLVGLAVAAQGTTLLGALPLEQLDKDLVLDKQFLLAVIFLLLEEEVLEGEALTKQTVEELVAQVGQE